MAKRVSDENGVDDLLYREIKRQLDDNRQKVQKVLSAKCKHAPLEGIDTFFSRLGPKVVEQIIGSTSSLRAEFTLFTMESSPWTRMTIPCDWWILVCEWNNDLDETESLFQVHGSESELEAFRTSRNSEVQLLRNAITNGWNTWHPKLPATWSDDGTDLIISIVE
jgi:hypothetical protein